MALLLASACSGDGSSAHPPPPPAVRPATPATPVTAAVDSSRPSPAATTRIAQQGDTSSLHRVTPRLPVLSDDEQRIADGIVFVPSMTDRFIVAGRNRRLLVDIGRVDLETKQDAEQLRLIRRVSARVGPFARTARVSVRGTWGEETDSIAGYDVWNGRAVAVLAASARVDSLIARNVPLVGVAVRAAADATPVVAASAIATPMSAACVRDSVAPALRARVALVRDSLVRWMTDSLKPPFPRLAKAAVVRGDAATGCFAAWRAVVIVTSRTPSLEWNEERALLVAPDGVVTVARLRDLRLRAHESLMSFDADGDGIDELAARGLATRMGAQSVLALDPATRRFSRYASGFAWESR